MAGARRGSTQTHHQTGLKQDDVETKTLFDAKTKSSKEPN